MIKEFIQRIRRKEELRQQDELWEATGDPCWSLFPPSFYATHTKEEAEQAEREVLEECQKLIEQLE